MKSAFGEKPDGGLQQAPVGALPVRRVMSSGCPLPFLINSYHAAILAAIITVAIELVVLAVIRARFFRTGFLRSFATVTLGGVIIVAVSAALGSAA